MRIYQSGAEQCIEFGIVTGTLSPGTVRDKSNAGRERIRAMHKTAGVWTPSKRRSIPCSTSRNKRRAARYYAQLAYSCATAAVDRTLPLRTTTPFICTCLSN
jgi:hypothetical protein